MKKLLFLLTMGVLSSLQILAQSFCRTPSVINFDTRHLIRQRSTEFTPATFALRVFFHVIRESNGTGGQSLENVQAAFEILNNDFNPHHIFFLWDGTIDYINNSALYNLPDESVFQLNSHYNGIDIYLYSDDPLGFGVASGVGSGTAFIVGGSFFKIPYPSYVTSHVVSHEMGHVLALFHTHHGTSVGERDEMTCAELVDGSNSAECGDFVTDTPADPNLNFDVSSVTYQWLGSGQDENGDDYNPDTRLIMSYTDIRCMSYFSEGQGERMRQAISVLPHLQSAQVSIQGPTIPCTSDVYNVGNLPNGFSVSWSWKNNSTIPITQNSPSTNQCTIANSNKAYIKNTLVATISKNGTVITSVEKEIDTGANFYGTYEQEAAVLGVGATVPACPPTAFHSGDTIVLSKGSHITLKSPKFVGANVYCSSSLFGIWLHQDSIIDVYVQAQLPSWYTNSISSLPFPHSMTFTGTYPNNCEVFKFKLNLTDVIPLLPLSLQVIPSGTGYNIMLQRSSSRDITEADTGNNSRNKLSDWNLTIVHSLSGKAVYDNRITGVQKFVDTAGWMPGVYVVRAQIGDEVLTQKIFVAQ